MEKNITFVGLDVHKKSISVAVAEGYARGAGRFVGNIPNTPDALSKLAGKLADKGPRGGMLRFCYEAGPCGYGVWRHLRGLVFTVEELMRFPPESRFYFLECAANGGMEWHGAQLNSVQFTHGMVHCCQYTGVPLKTLLREAGVKPKAKWILAEGADSAAMTRSIPMDKALADAMVVYSQNGERLRAEQGYPLRLVVPGWEGNMWIKWLRRLEVGDRPWHTREETSKYTDLMADGTARQFTWIMEAKSVITNPSPEKPLTYKGFRVVTGLAWSGRGRIKRVDVSTDGGRNWRTARLEAPVFSKCLTRFYFDWDWNGQPALLQSRAIDETGYVQPSMARLRDVRGPNSIYHNNAVHTWSIVANGEVENVQLS